MTCLYENIKKRRTELNISQQELAEAVGYKGKSMISQIESGKVDIPASMISKIANALNYSESDLMCSVCLAGEQDEAGTTELLKHTNKLKQLPPEYRNIVYTSINSVYEAYILTKEKET